MATETSKCIEEITAKSFWYDVMIEAYHVELRVSEGQKTTYVHGCCLGDPECTDFYVSEKPMMPLIISDEAGDTEDAFIEAQDAATHYGSSDFPTAATGYSSLFNVVQGIIVDMTETY